SIRNWATVTCTFTIDPASASRSTGLLSIGTESGHRARVGPYRLTADIEARERTQPFCLGQDPRAAAEIYDALTLWVLGRIDKALPLADRALTDAEAAAHAPTMAYALFHAAGLGLLRYNAEAVATYSQASAGIAARYDLPAILAVGLGWGK